MDRYALTCPCTCHGRGDRHAPCDPQYPDGCGYVHAGRACPACTQPTEDSALCRTCTSRLAADLAAVPELHAELEVWRVKLDRIGGRDPRGGSHVPLGYRPMAVEVYDVLHLTLTSWAGDVARAAGVPTPELYGRHPGPLAVWLGRHAEAARHMATVAAFVDEVAYAVRVTRRAIDRPADRQYAGPCDECTADLYAWPGADTVGCRGCGAQYPVPARRAWLLDGLREHLATAAEISAGIGELYGQPVNRRTINVWHHRERLEAKGHTREGWPLYRIGDVLDLAGASAVSARAS